MTKHIAIAALAAIVALSACDENGVRTIDGPLPSSAIKFYNFGVNSPPVNFYADGVKMTAAPSATGVESDSGTSYGRTSGDFYTAINPGSHQLSGRISVPTNRNTQISQLTSTLENGKRYSYFQSGKYDTATKTVDAFIIEDQLPGFDFTAAYIRFVHAIYNAKPLTLYVKSDSAGSTEQTIGSEVAYKSATGFVKISPGSYSLYARYGGSATNIITRTAQTFSAGRVYTIAARGDTTVTSTTAAARPLLDNTVNR